MCEGVLGPPGLFPFYPRSLGEVATTPVSSKSPCCSLRPGCRNREGSQGAAFRFSSAIWKWSRRSLRTPLPLTQEFCSTPRTYWKYNQSLWHKIVLYKKIIMSWKQPSCPTMRDRPGEPSPFPWTIYYITTKAMVKPSLK